MLVPTNERKEKVKNMKNCKVRDLIRSVTKNPDDYDEKYMKIKSNSNDETIEIPSMIAVVWAIFLKNDKYCLQVSLDKFLYKL